MLSSVLLHEKLERNALAYLDRQTAEIAVVDRRLARFNAGDSVGDIHRLAEQRIAPLCGSVLVQQIVAVAVLELANCGAHCLAHDPNGISLINVRHGVLNVDKLVRGNNGL